MGSTRLPEKIMRRIGGKTVLEHVVERASMAKLIDGVVVATTELPEDDAIARHMSALGVRCSRGSSGDVLARYYGAAVECGRPENIVRITSDCPLYDPFVADEVIRFFMDGDFDIVTCGGRLPEQRTYPRGLDTEIMSFGALKDAFLNAKAPHQREHVTPYIYETSRKAYYYRNRDDLSKYRWTLDTRQDWEFISAVYGRLYHGRHDFFCADVVALLQANPQIYELNRHVEQKALF
jgi:spore coat polysaccharide biosynthesis protein SpsF